MPANTQIINPDASGLLQAARLLGDGALVAFATETVYGLGADATNDRAVARVFEAKGRPHFNPLIVHLASLGAAHRLAHFDERAARLADIFWPGPLTLVLPLRMPSSLSPLVTAGLDSVAIRLPAHEGARALLEAFGGPVAAPSANPSGRISPTRAAHVLAGLGGRIEAVLDGGPCDVGLESTIVGLTGPDALLLRPGGLPAEVIEQALGAPLVLPDAGDGVTAPGQLRSHYAPQAPMRLNVTALRPGERLLGFGPVEGAVINLSRAGDMTEAAANLFHALRELDQGGTAPIAVSPIPDHGLGRAINDRLARAAAPRP